MAPNIPRRRAARISRGITPAADQRIMARADSADAADALFMAG